MAKSKRPTVGQIVLYTFSNDTKLHCRATAGQSETVPAIVVNVWTDECVNLRVFQDGEKKPLWVPSALRKDKAVPGDGYWGPAT